MGVDINKVTANIVAVGKHGKHDLDEVNKLVMHFLKKDLDGTKYGFIARWDHDSKTVYTIAYPHLDDKMNDPKISVFDYPISFDAWSRTLKYSNLPENLFEDSGPKLICSLEASLSGNKFKSAKKLYGNGNRCLELLKKSEAEIIPGRSLVLLLDNGHTLFTDKQFIDYIVRNKNSMRFW